MSNTNSLSRDETHCLRRRWALALGAMVADTVINVVAMVELGYEGRFVWVAGSIPGVFLCFVLREWAAQCPHCRESVFGTGDVEEWKRHPEDSGWVFLLPHRCRRCEVRLTATEPAEPAL